MEIDKKIALRDLFEDKKHSRAIMVLLPCVCVDKIHNWARDGKFFYESVIN